MPSCKFAGQVPAGSGPATNGVRHVRFPFDGGFGCVRRENEAGSTAKACWTAQVECQKPGFIASYARRLCWCVSCTVTFSGLFGVALDCPCCLV